MEEAITLYISGHGNEDIDEKFINNKTVKLLSFVGIPGESGIMKFCKNYKNTPIDIVTIDFLHNQYSNHGNLSNSVQKDILDFVAEELPIIYKNCNIEYKDGFSLTWPRYERQFTFEPGPHENCRICNNNGDDSLKNSNNKCLNGRCLPERKLKNIRCPEYGITVVTSSYSSDIPYTLGGSSNRIMANMNMYLPAKDYWKSRASNEYKYLIDQIYNEKFIHLTDIYLLFSSMGFKHIYIYDPTCRDCDINEMNAQQNRNLEMTEPIIEQPLDYNIKKTDIYNNKNNNNNNNKNNYVNECINGICNLFQKTKVSGGKKRKTIKKIKKKKRKSIKKSKRSKRSKRI